MENVKLERFIEEIKDSNLLWGMQDPVSEDWVVFDSIEFENTDTFLLWSSNELAAIHCTEEWSEYRPASITIEEYLEFWVESLHEDGLLVGINWDLDNDCLEVDPIELAKHLVEIEPEHS